MSYLNCGVIETPKNRSEVRFVVYKFKDIQTKIIPYFNSYPLQGVKKEDFKDFNRVADLMENKSHLSSEGLQKIKLIKANMNRDRVHKV
jgi:hypothetical protein